MHSTEDEGQSSTNYSHRGRRRPPSHLKRDVGGTIGQASWISSVVNLLNTILGAGLLAMPLAMSHMGILLGTIVILWAGLTAAFGLYLQTRCAQYLERGSASFFALSQLTYPNAAVVFDAAIAIKCFGVGVSYLIIIGDLMPGVIDISGLIVIPLSFLRRLDSLKYTSVIALISIGYLVILVVYHFCAGDTLRQDRTPIRVIRWAGPIPTLSSFPVIVFAYTCHQNMFSVLNEIGNNSHFRTSSVAIVSNGTAAAIYVLVAITGYLSFGNDIGGNIVAQYLPSVSATIGRAAIVVLVLFSYPLQVHPCRASVDAVLKWRPKSLLRSSGPSSLDSSPPRSTPLLLTGRKRNDGSLSETRFAAITTAIIILSFIVAMTVNSLEAVLAYVGSTGSTSISFILPGLFYYKISSLDSALHQRLLKEEDDYDADIEDNHSDADAAGEERDGLLSGSGILSSSMVMLRNNTKAFRRKLLRRLSLALAIYGLLVMVVCLITNTFFIVAH
ncbi:hypothetical protein EPUS_01135 [Endocarpon pusillum Z07020]|uniref:Amino acid transporter transmembrane domain-containing protein n=1 Tax=Endocarpon pusillum (strain Z07020 / HMAS-L-300199) TaxID=1263415 RepID=U1GAZ8_ENDPU|nr:uncharacterized protein EPUS_01135 [Endocarpon pusillum Z07020]ERF69178.1 hypothetical protein EPUS_01135 [Endocarpon pusillum Z07020]